MMGGLQLLAKLQQPHPKWWFMDNGLSLARVLHPKLKLFSSLARARFISRGYLSTPHPQLCRIEKPQLPPQSSNFLNTMQDATKFGVMFSVGAGLPCGKARSQGAPEERSTLIVSNYTLDHFWGSSCHLYTPTGPCGGKRLG